MNIRFLETFVWVARLRSFRLAAEHVHATQAAVSQRVAALEADLGVRLLDRSRRDVQLTREGQFVYERTEAIVNLYGDTRRRMSGGKSLKPTIRLGITDTVSLTFLPILFRLLIQEYQVESVDAKIDLPISHYQALKNGDIDAAIGPVTSQAEELVHVGLCSLAMVWVASPALGVPRTALSIQELVRFPIISHARASLPHRLIVEQLQTGGVRGARLHSVSTLAGVLHLVCGGAGISAVPHVLVHQLARNDQIHILDVQEPFPDVQLSVAHLHAPEDSTARQLTAVTKESVRTYCENAPAGSVSLI